MEPDARYTFVGVVIIALVSAIVATSLWLSKSGSDSEYRFFTVYFRNHSLSGLQIDSDVTMKGIRIGTVTSVKILPTDIERPRVILKITRDTPVSIDTQAEIRRNVLTGLAGIDLIPGSGATLSDISPGENYPIIKEGTAGIEALTNSLPSILENANTLMVRITSFFSEDNQKSFSQILKDVSVVSGTASEAGTLIKDLKNFIHELGGKSDSLTQTMSNSANHISLEVSRIAESLSQASSSLSNTAQQFEDPRKLILGPDKKTLGPGETLKK